ncbi:MAG: type II toxin-antitoxin system HicA family toxin [Acidobacteriia bacterium]|nr:type II toxin-antitoxin system HicA family toxin [Terriglobia bacterium]
MEDALPAQLTWREFLCVLNQLGYRQLKNKRGSARSFHNPAREPKVVTFHEPHGKDSIRLGTLREYIEKLLLKKEEFLQLLKNC